MIGRDPGTWELDGDLALVPVQFDALLEALEVGDRELRADAVSAWSVGQQLIHTALVATSIALAVRRLVRGGGNPEGALGEDGIEILKSGVVPRGQGQAPEPSRRDETPPEEEIADALAKARRKWSVILPQAEAIRAAGDRMHHPALGPMTAAEWVRFETVHAAHHLTIVDEIRGG